MRRKRSKHSSSSLKKKILWTNQYTNRTKCPSGSCNRSGKKPHEFKFHNLKKTWRFDKQRCIHNEVKEVDRSILGSFVVLYFSSQNDEKIGLVFSTGNLGDELRNYGRDGVAQSDESLRWFFSEAVQRFISERYPINLSEKDIPTIFSCTLVAHETINQITHPNMLEARTENPR